MTLSVYTILHEPRQFARRSGLLPLVEALEAHPVFYEDTWRKIMSHSWTLGHWVRLAGNRYYGSTWNSLLPVLDEWKLARQLPRNVDIAHFLWGEFASPRYVGPFRRRARRIVGTFHASARRLPHVLNGFRALDSYDAITLMSKSQIPYFIDRGVPESRMRVILHGVDTAHYTPAPDRPALREGPLRGLLVGSTERDHAFMAAVLKKLPAGILEMTILTAYDQRILNYPNTPHCVFPEHLSDDDLLTAYRQADLLVMPMLDCTANNAMLESMACATPILTNRVGGISEYVNDAHNYVMNDKVVDEWVDLLVHLSERREELLLKRPYVRDWVEGFDWSIKAKDYRETYVCCMAQGRI